MPNYFGCNNSYIATEDLRSGFGEGTSGLKIEGSVWIMCEVLSRGVVAVKEGGIKAFRIRFEQRFRSEYPSVQTLDLAGRKKDQALSFVGDKYRPTIQRLQ